MKFKSGSFAVPGATGNYSVTGLGFQPQGVYFFGSNRAPLDTVVTGGEHSAFGGMMARKWDDQSLLSHSVWCMPNGPNPTPGPKSSRLDFPPINCLTRIAATIVQDYRADAVSLDADGFTVNFTTVPATARYVHWLAWGEADNDGAVKTTGTVTLPLGYRVKSFLTLGSFDNGDGIAPYDSSHWAWWGSGSYPPSMLDWRGTYMMDVSLSQQRITNVSSSASPPPTTENYRGGVAGTILGGQQRARPSGVGLTDLLIQYVSSASVYDFSAWWDGESSEGGVTPSNVLNAEVETTIQNAAEIDAIAAMLFFTTGDTTAFGTGLVGNIGFGVATPDHQACVYLDGSATRLYQSITKGWCCDVGVAGATAGSVELEPTGGKFKLKNLSVGPAARGMVYNAWGPLEEEVRRFRPQIYRRITG